MLTLKELYLEGLNGKYDASEHMEYLIDCVKPSDIVVEIGVQFGRCSSVAFALAHPFRQICIDILAQERFKNFMEVALNEMRNIEYIVKDNLKIRIPNCDILYIDSYHTYSQLRDELEIHGNKSGRLIIIHDTADSCCGVKGQDDKTPGLKQAILEFVHNNPQWKIDRIVDFNNGLTTLKRSI